MPKTASDLFGTAHDSQDVAAHQQMNLTGLVSSVEQFLSDDRVRRHVVQLPRRFSDAIEIGAEADMLDPRHFDDVVAM